MNNIFGIDPSNGEILWRVAHDQSSDPNMRRYELIKCTTPLYQDGMLYIYDKKRGNVGLVKVNPEKFDLVSSFQVTLGDAGPFWAHPVIHNGILYLRHTNALMAYDIKT